MLRAIIFDCFGVLTTEGWLPFKHRHFGENKQQFDEASELRRQVDAGLLPYANFVETIAGMAKVEPSTVRHALEHNVANDQLFDYIQTHLKPKFKIGLLSNTGSDTLNRLFAPARVALFDEVDLSYETGITKPDPRAYEAIARKLGIEPSEAVFIDDQERHCSGARETGMQAILYEDFDQFKTDLGQLLANPEI